MANHRRKGLIPVYPLLITVVFFFGFAIAQQDDPFHRERARMVEKDLAGRDIVDPKVLQAMGKVPRHLFVSRELWDQAYADHPLPIEEGQTISQPYVVALMTQALEIKPGQRVLEIGTGSGYQAAVLAELGANVYTLEIRKALALKAAQLLKQMEYTSVQVKYGDGYDGWEEMAPFDAILMTCAADRIPPPLLKQLKIGGKLILPLGSNGYFQTLAKVTKKESSEDISYLGDVAFVPMTGKLHRR